MSKKGRHKVEIELSAEKITVSEANCSNGCDLMVPSIPIHEHASIGLRFSFGDQKGMIYLDPTYGSFDNESDIEIPKGQVVSLHCPKCGVSLEDEGELCQTCSSPMFALHLPKGGVVIGCLKKGCFFHRLRIIDPEARFARLIEDQLGGDRLMM